MTVTIALYKHICSVWHVNMCTRVMFSFLSFCDFTSWLRARFCGIWCLIWYFWYACCKF